MSNADRASFAAASGHPNAGRTAAECDQASADRAEKIAQREIAQYLNMLGIPHINPPMNKRSQLPLGWPDFTFAAQGVPFAVEVKVRGRQPRPEQATMLGKLASAGWRTAVISGAADLKDFMRKQLNNQQTNQ
jgi:hypothetical protein